MFTKHIERGGVGEPQQKRLTRIERNNESRNNKIKIEADEKHRGKGKGEGDEWWGE